jgi:hypothetical protein
MSWIWLNIGPGALFFLAMAGIPLWMVIKRPDQGPSFVLPGRVAVTDYREVPVGA